MPLSSPVAKRREGHGADVYLIHGWGMHSRLWGTLPERLCDDGYRPHLIDLPGHGGTPPLPRNDLMELTHAMAERIDRRGCLVGWSLGGAVALMLAAIYPERVNGLVLTGTSPCFVQGPEWPHGMENDTFSDFRIRVQTDPDRALLWFLGLQVRDSVHERRTLRDLRSLIGEAPTADATALLDDLDILKDNDLRTMLARIEVPVVIIHGERDGLVPFASAEYLAEGLPNARLVRIDGAGHAPFLSHPEAFYTALQGESDV